MAGPRPRGWPRAAGAAGPHPQLHQGPPWAPGQPPPPASMGKEGSSGTPRGSRCRLGGARQHLTWTSRSRACTIFLRSQRLRAVTMATWPCTHSSFCNKNDTLVEETGPSPQQGPQDSRHPRAASCASGHRRGTHLTQHKLHITELAALPQPPIVFMQRALGVTGELQETPWCRGQPLRALALPQASGALENPVPSPAQPSPLPPQPAVSPSAAPPLPLHWGS